jgi:GNAT superfamily N-acetyltransferase
LVVVTLREEQDALPHPVSGSERTYEVLVGIDERTAEDVAHLYALVGWGSDHRVDEVHTALLNTGCVVRAISDTGATVAFARVFGDGRFYTCVGEVVVHPEWQRRGVGSTLLAKVSELYPRSPIFLETFRGQEGFFLRSGFVAKHRMVVMSKKRATS